MLQREDGRNDPEIWDLVNTNPEYAALTAVRVQFTEWARTPEECLAIANLVDAETLMLTGLYDRFARVEERPSAVISREFSPTYQSDSNAARTVETDYERVDNGEAIFL